MPRHLESGFVALVAVLAVCADITIYTAGFAWPPIRSDGYSYYAYLPSWFIYHDPTLEALARDCCGGTFPEFTAMFRWPGTGAWINPHPMGVAMLAAPFFVIAHLLTRWSNLPPDGFSLYYQLVAGVAGVFYLVAGIWFLQRALRRFFPADVTLATLVAITWGTNLFHYGTFDSSFSHVFSFALFALLLFLTPLWWEAPTYRRSLAIGAVAGLIVVTRHTNALLLVFTILYGVTGLPAARARVGFLKARWREVAAMLAAAALVALPQLGMYWHATGRWAISPYGPGLWFNFSSPKILEVMFSTQKGLFFWSPVLLLAALGFAVMPRYVPGLVLPAAIVLPVNLYLIASWWDWQFGASYGHRAFTDILPIFAFGLAAFFSRIRLTSWKPAIATLGTLAIALSVVQMIQYWLRIVPFSGTTWETYQSIFLRFSR